MSSTFGNLEIAKSGMMAYNAAMQTTAHNIANIHTKGYSRQTANIVSLVGNKSSLTVQGYGTRVVDITRKRNEYFDTKYQATQSSYNKYDTDFYYLKALQDSICGNVTADEEQAGIGESFDKFNAALSNLVGNPNNTTVRTEAVTVAQTFTENVNNAAKKLQTMQQEANEEIKSCIGQINAYADRIISLNRQINTIESYGNPANDLRDQRSLLIDELSQYCNVETLEKAPADGIGDVQYYVYIDGHCLVDTYNTNHLVVRQKDTYSNIGDIEGCYEVSWEDGTGFSCYSSQLGGKLQSLFEMRDGNNDTVVKGTVGDYDEASKKLTITDANCNDIATLNIPAYDGEIVINNRTYYYDSFEVKTDADGNYTYEFVLKNPSTELLQIAKDKGYTASVGVAVNAKGIPFYMAQLNEFVRTYAQEFNRIQKQGLDLNDNPGIDFFNSTVPDLGVNYVMQESENGVAPSFSSIPGEKDANGNYVGSYYYVTALNFCVTRDVLNDGTKIACKGRAFDSDGKEVSVGSDNGDNIQLLSKLKDNGDMFVHGAPDEFIQYITSSLGVNAQKAESMSKSESNLLYAIDESRQSVSGVDEDEEGANMIIFQNMLNNQYKVLAVMNEVLDKLINGMI